VTSSRVVLLGDSILDNAPYTDPEPDTTAHLRRMLGSEWHVERLARDGATMNSVPSQLKQLEGRPTVAVLSVGGNDATQHIGLLEREAATAAEVLDELVSIADDFGRKRSRNGVLSLGPRVGEE
jgi:lysophospholipase L1-like esterase